MAPLAATDERSPVGGHHARKSPPPAVSRAAAGALGESGGRGHWVLRPQTLGAALISARMSSGADRRPLADPALRRGRAEDGTGGSCSGPAGGRRAQATAPAGLGGAVGQGGGIKPKQDRTAHGGCLQLVVHTGAFVRGYPFDLSQLEV